jgi:hypothetical protein
MRQVVVFVVILAAVTLAVGGMTRAQEELGTPDLETTLCASPEASPAASPDFEIGASPETAEEEVFEEIGASPETAEEEDIEEIEDDLDEIICGSPEASESP